MLFICSSVFFCICFRITEHLGSGEFGTVNKGVWHTEQGDLDIAVKMLNSKADEKDTVRFLQEAAIMGQFRHPNIVRLHGVVTVGEPVSTVCACVRERVCVCVHVWFQVVYSNATEI